MRRLLPLLALALTLCAAGCVTMPTSGPVTESVTSGAQNQGGVVNINPRRPGEDDTPEEIVRGFLEAMTATPPIKTSVAREFLTREAAATWQPTETIIYSTFATQRGTQEVSVVLEDAHRTDAQGAWLGSLGAAESTLDFAVVLQDNQYRISAPPDALIVPQSWFEQRFRQASLYFFDPSASILVPEPVFVPRGRQLASALVKGLLAGPASGLEAYELTFLPADLRSLVSVVVSAEGIAQVDLASDAGDDLMPAPTEAELLVSQLAWTLRQDPEIAAFRVTIGGRPVQLPDQTTTFDVSHGHAYAPYVAGSSTQLFGLRDGVVVAGSPQNLEPVAGPFGTPGYLLRAVAADLRADQTAVVTEAGTEVYVAGLRSADPGVTRVATGEDLLEPAWDFSGRLWLVDRASGGSVVSYVQDGRTRTIDVPGISGADVKDFLVSRDGSRLIAVLRVDAETDVLVASRILTGGDGTVRAARAAVPIGESADLDPTIRSIAWRSPTSLLVLHPLSARLFKVRTASVDGAPVGPDAVAVTLDTEVLGLAGTPTPGETPWAVTDGALSDLAGPRGNVLDIGPGLSSLDYAG